MADTGKVAEFFVEFQAQGLDSLAEGMKSLGEGLAGLAAQVGQLSPLLAQALGQAQAGTRGLQAGLASVAPTLAVVNAGLAQMARQPGPSFRYDAGPLQRLASLAGAVRDQAAGMVLGLDQAAGRLGQAFVGIGRGFGHLAQGAAGLGQALAPVSMGLFGFVTAGVAASVAGQVIGQRMEELSRQIASLFLPQINWLIDRLTALVRWFQSLSGEQQAQLRQWGLLIAGLTATALLLPHLIALFQGLQAAAVALRVAFVALAASNPFLLLGTVLGAAVLSTVSLQDVTATFLDISKEVAQPFRELLGVLREIGGALRDMGDQARGLLGGRARGVADASGQAQGGWDWRDLSLYHLTDSFNPTYQAFSALGMPTFGRRAQQVTNWLGLPLGVAAFIPNALGLNPNLGYTPPAGQGEQRQELAPRTGPIEDIQATYRRIAQASSRLGTAARSPQEQAVEHLAEIQRGVERLDRVAGTIRPPVVR